MKKTNWKIVSDKVIVFELDTNKSIARKVEALAENLAQVCRYKNFEIVKDGATHDLKAVGVSIAELLEKGFYTYNGSTNVEVGRDHRPARVCPQCGKAYLDFPSKVDTIDSDICPACGIKHVINTQGLEVGREKSI